MKITIFGTGYVGLVTGTCLAEVGHEVMCVDINEEKIENLKEGIIPIYEPGLSELVLRNYREKRLNFTTHASIGVEFAEVIMSAVGTPPDANHRADLQYVREVARTVGENMSDYKVFINKSTVPVGTGKLCSDIIQKELDARGMNITFDVVSNPEFLKEGSAIKDFMTPDRIVCGLSSPTAKSQMEELYKPFVRTTAPLLFTSLESAEIIKYASNAFLATKISFINEIANFAELVGANISDISRCVGMDERIGSRFLHAGIGYGGSCFPKDVQALIETGKDYGYEFQIIRATEQVNERQKTRVIEKLLKHIPDLTGKKIALWGLSFKPKTDDTRDAASHEVIKSLLQLDVHEIRAFDPVAREHMAQVYKNESRIRFMHTSYEALEDADALIVLTEWDEFRAVDLNRIKSLLHSPLVIDGRNIWNRTELENLGFTYEGIGK
ncbi:UDP-glucose/GDP-mannose dehydrogenase family protein [Candidatus Gracilibacteria bacterium]|nr:UDP-glucose/GDP-mannose dehydrogenase family protein [Candidatus Gracilibacteria bacterium]